ncbi:hypothetical protein MKZ38_006520 [Zalerion maritima]|uniref:Uncharacterized protein n=1 Tax=Zalerion maritima TaxID=339359 RepID=A0AAD5WXM5_9PEZI|nr:hypothetical protein MKZ38_006520 [Zalerion maritima]
MLPPKLPPPLPLPPRRFELEFEFRCGGVGYDITSLWFLHGSRRTNERTNEQAEGRNDDGRDRCTATERTSPTTIWLFACGRARARTHTPNQLEHGSKLLKALEVECRRKEQTGVYLSIGVK